MSLYIQVNNVSKAVEIPLPCALTFILCPYKFGNIFLSQSTPEIETDIVNNYMNFHCTHNNVSQ